MNNNKCMICCQQIFNCSVLMDIPFCTAIMNSNFGVLEEGSERGGTTIRDYVKEWNVDGPDVSSM